MYYLCYTCIALYYLTPVYSKAILFIKKCIVLKILIELVFIVFIINYLKNTLEPGNLARSQSYIK